MIKILIADDHSMMIDGIKTTLSDIAEMEIIGEASNGKEVLKFLESHHADIILMDVNMPLMDGLECTKIVTENYPNTKVIALTQFNESRFVKRMIKNGSSGYLIKDAQKEELVTAILNVYQGNLYFDKDLHFIISQDPQADSGRKNLIAKLTDRELEILKLICNEFSSLEIATQLSIAFNTVERHRASLITKSGAKNTAGLVRWAAENDLID